MEKFVRLLSSPVNFAVVQLPERQYPGIVVQGDTLNALLRSVEEMARLLKANKMEDLALEIDEVCGQLTDARGIYEAVCLAQGIELPYVEKTG